MLTTPTLWPPRHARSTARSRWSSHARRTDCVPVTVCVSEPMPMPMALCRRPRPRGSIGGGPNTEAGEQRAGYATADPTAPRHCHGGVVSKIRLHHAASHRKTNLRSSGQGLSSGVQGPRHGGLPARRGTGANPEGQTNADSAVATCARTPSAIAVRLLAALWPISARSRLSLLFQCLTR